MPTVCPRLVVAGSCDQANCTHRHQLFNCASCNRVFPDRSSYNGHIRTPRHSLNVAAPFAVMSCPMCLVSGLTRGLWTAHISSKEHRRRAAAQGVSVDVEPIEAGAPRHSRICDPCNTVVFDNQWSNHLRGRVHAKSVRFQAYKAVYGEAAKDKHGVTISHAEKGINFDVVASADALRGVQQSLVIRATDRQPQVSIIDLKWSSSISGKTSPSFTTTAGSMPLRLESSAETCITVTFRQPAVLIGRYEDKLEITFQDESHGRFTIVRSVRAIVGNREDYEALKPSAPYVPRHKGPKRAEKRIVEGIPPPSLNAVEWVRKLPEAEIPKQLLSILAMKSVDDIVNELKHNVIRGDLSPELYGLYFKTLLWVEEHRMGIDLQMFDIPNASLTPKGSLFSLRVPGLAEKRPSVLIGDRIIVQRGEDQSGKWFEGHVHAVDQLEVHLRFHGSFPKPAPTQRFHVRFKLNRIPLRRQHQAMDTSFMSDRILFPNESHTGTVGDNDNVPITPYNELIATNLPQSRAVRIGVDLPAGAPPLLIYGPAGTGKTSTIVELIKQILTKYPSARILACAPSNSAADLIASRLSSLGTDQLFRFYASSRFVRTVPVELLPFTHINANGHFSHHSLEKMCTYRVLVTTCVSASVAYGIGMPRGHFSHIFVDEAGHATEPEAMVSIKTMADSKTNIILSGDPKQLGPIIRSPVARRLGLDKSFIERLLDLDIYQNLRDGLTVVKLLKNYRSHPAILSYPNERFYDGELEPCGDPQVINTFIGNPLLVSKTFPIVFHAMAGEDAREASSPSYFNVEEVLQVKAYVEALLADQTVEIGMFSSPGSDIGIITPYHAQVQKIRKALKGVVEGVTVGSVEEFQGQERLVIIMSTVRSSQDLVEFDLRHTLGFVANPRRFNVAVTRAKALLIVVGDPTVLSLDPLWRGFLNYVYLNDGWKGVPISWDPNEPVREEGGYDAELRAQGVSDITAFAERMQNLTLQGVASGEVGDEDANEDQPWVEPE